MKYDQYVLADLTAISNWADMALENAKMGRPARVVRADLATVKARLESAMLALVSL